MKQQIQRLLSPSRQRIFVSYAREDVTRAREIHDLLLKEGFVPWADFADLVAGQDWDAEIRAAIKAARLVILLLSGHSVSKRGYFQKEIREALDVADTMPAGAAYIIPVRLDDCVVPERVARWHYIDALESTDFPRLIRALNSHLEESKRKEPKKASPARLADRDFARSCRERGQFLCCRYRGGFAVSDGAILMLRSQLGPTLHRLRKANIIQKDISASAVRRLLTPSPDWKEKKVVTIKKYTPTKLALYDTAKTEVLLARHYHSIILRRYPRSSLYLPRPNSPIIVGDAEKNRVDAAVMPMLP